MGIDDSFLFPKIKSRILLLKSPARPNVKEKRGTSKKGKGTVTDKALKESAKTAKKTTTKKKKKKKND